MHSDAATWGLILQVVALFLTLPLAIIGTLLAPKVEDWFATMSQKSLAARIDKLDRKINQLDKEPLLTKTEDQIVKFLERAILSLGYIFAILVIVIYQSTQIPFIIQPHLGLSMGDAIIISGIFGLLIVGIVWPIRTWRKERTKEYREALRGKINRLTLKGL
jgi:hypothetical protein